MHKNSISHLLSLTDLSQKEYDDLIYKTAIIKSTPKKYYSQLKGKILGLLFNKPSTRTRVSFESGMYQLGGNVTFLSENEIQIQRGESIQDTAKVLSRYIDAIVIRTFEQETLIEYAQHSDIPVINGLTDKFHPCQILSDIFTIKEKLKSVTNKTITFIGDGNNNMAHSWLLATFLSGINLKIVTPPEYLPKTDIYQKALELIENSGKGSIEILHNPKEIEYSDIIYTDVWTSMGQESERERKLKLLSAYQVNSNLINSIKNNPLIMHCLPAHLGEEITGEIMYSPQSIVFDQAENRLHLQKALLLKLISD